LSSLQEPFFSTLLASISDSRKGKSIAEKRSSRLKSNIGYSSLKYRWIPGLCRRKQDGVRLCAGKKNRHRESDSMPPLSRQKKAKAVLYGTIIQVFTRGRKYDDLSTGNLLHVLLGNF
jgi:hypothetical protein